MPSVHSCFSTIFDVREQIFETFTDYDVISRWPRVFAPVTHMPLIFQPAEQNIHFTPPPFTSSKWNNHINKFLFNCYHLISVTFFFGLRRYKAPSLELILWPHFKSKSINLF